MKSEENNKRAMRAKMNDVEAKLNELLGELESLGFVLDVNQIPADTTHQLNGVVIRTPRRFRLTAIKTTREVI